MDLSLNGPDATSQASPYRVWVNNGQDEPGTGGNLDYDVEVPPASTNYAAGKITCQRDLENFFRLWICGVPSLWLSWNYTFTLSMSPSSGNPAINVYESCETNGGTGYLTDTNIAAQQVTNNYGVSLGTVSNNCSCTIPSIAFAFGGTQHFLFEGAGIGSGELVLTISQNSNTIAQTGVWLDLHDIKDLYEQASVTGVNTDWPFAGSETNQSTFQSDKEIASNPAEAQQLIVFVHGWRMSPWDYYDFSETMFKRLYWAGYKGRFASLRWPTLSKQTDGSLGQYLTYNRSEHIAFESARGASAYFDWLASRFPDYSINVAAHSMGNIVMMETLKDQLAAGHYAIDNYVLMQAAVPAHCYDTSLANYSRFDSPPLAYTPDTYRGYPGSINNALNGSMVNFFNTNDYALATGTYGGAQANWEQNQQSLKPDNALGYFYYTDLNGAYFNPSGNPNTPGRLVTDLYELMPFVARPHSKAAGAQPGIAGIINGQEVDLHTSFGFDRPSEDHSAQFNWNVQRVEPFYVTLLNKLFPPQ